MLGNIENGMAVEQERFDAAMPDPQRDLFLQCPECGYSWKSTDWGDGVLESLVERHDCRQSEFDVYPNCLECGCEGVEEEE